MVMTEANPVQRLRATDPKLELWWDSSPLLFEEWVKGPGSAYRDAGLFELRREGALGFGAASLLQGATTNQPLTWQVIDRWPERWRSWLANQLSQEPKLSTAECNASSNAVTDAP